MTVHYIDLRRKASAPLLRGRKGGGVNPVFSKLVRKGERRPCTPSIPGNSFVRIGARRRGVRPFDQNTVRDKGGDACAACILIGIQGKGGKSHPSAVSSFSRGKKSWNRRYMSRKEDPSSQRTRRGRFHPRYGEPGEGGRGHPSRWGFMSASSFKRFPITRDKIILQRREGGKNGTAGAVRRSYQKGNA